jgi:putative transposase
VQELGQRSVEWLTEVVSVEETSTQVELAFTAALEAEGLMDQVDARLDDGRVDLGVDDETRPILLAVSDNGPQMTSGSTRDSWRCARSPSTSAALAPRPTRPGSRASTGTSRAVPPPPRDRGPTDAACRAGPRTRAIQHRHRHAGIGYVCPDDEHEGRGEAIRKAREAGLERARLRRLARHRAQREDTTSRGPADVV